MRSNPDQHGIAIHQTHSPAYAEALEERWDRTYATWPKGKSNNATDLRESRVACSEIGLSFIIMGTT